MLETDFFTQLLGISRPWFISKVDLNKAKKRVDIYIQHSRDFAFPCPKCQRLCSVYDHMKERGFRHLNVCQMATFFMFVSRGLNVPNMGFCRSSMASEKTIRL
jgi:hypothetical protein